MRSTASFGLRRDPLTLAQGAWLNSRARHLCNAATGKTPGTQDTHTPGARTRRCVTAEPLPKPLSLDKVLHFLVYRRRF